MKILVMGLAGSGQTYLSQKLDPIIKNQIGFEIIGSNKEKEDDKKIIETSLKSLSKLNYRSGNLILVTQKFLNY